MAEAVDKISPLMEDAHFKKVGCIIARSRGPDTEVPGKLCGSGKYNRNPVDSSGRLTRVRGGSCQ